MPLIVLSLSSCQPKKNDKRFEDVFGFSLPPHTVIKGQAIHIDPTRDADKAHANIDVVYFGRFHMTPKGEEDLINTLQLKKTESDPMAIVPESPASGKWWDPPPSLEQLPMKDKYLYHDAGPATKFIRLLKYQGDVYLQASGLFKTKGPN